MKISLITLLIFVVIASARAATPPVVTIDQYAFKPDRIEVRVGTTVEWINKDEAPHSVNTPDRTLKSPTMDTNQHYTFRFTRPGTYSYYCGLHPMMKGTIVVR